ncbi:uncharacterized protein V1513DRAFT_46570 [Lipomyces chichibuensis]|uniref:uncharacterized protein n=1 Tax=Lipomyces chichibuensis TaxID=1546026 RepID=UPI0033432B44
MQSPFCLPQNFSMCYHEHSLVYAGVRLDRRPPLFIITFSSHFLSFGPIHILKFRHDHRFPSIVKLIISSTASIVSINIRWLLLVYSTCHCLKFTTSLHRR